MALKRQYHSNQHPRKGTCPLPVEAVVSGNTRMSCLSCCSCFIRLVPDPKHPGCPACTTGRSWHSPQSRKGPPSVKTTVETVPDANGRADEPGPEKPEPSDNEHDEWKVSIR